MSETVRTLRELSSGTVIAFIVEKIKLSLGVKIIVDYALLIENKTVNDNQGRL